MSDGRLTVWIGEREALPVRAIPFVTNYALPPDELLEQFSRLVEKPFKRLNNLCAYRLIDENETLITIDEWRDIHSRIQPLATEINANFDDLGLGHDLWSEQSLKLLPSDGFVWLTDFEREWGCDEERLGWGNTPLLLTPILALSLRSTVMMGFAKYVQLGATQSKPIDSNRNRRPPQQQVWQETQILDAIAAAGINPGELPVQLKGTRGVKYEIRKKLGLTPGVFNKAWERLRADGRIADAK